MEFAIIKKAFSRVNASKAQLMELAGLTALASGVGLIWLPLGVIVAGFGLLFMAWGSSTT